MDRLNTTFTAFLIDDKLEKRAKQPPLPAEALALMENPVVEQK